jgi:sensor domain CHASE-containing protein
MLIISSSLTVIICTLYLIVQAIVSGGFVKVERNLVDGFGLVEQQDVERNVGRVTDALNAMIQNLSTKSSDWAQWDDTYHYIVDKNSAFEESNLNPDGLFTLKSIS